MFKPSDCVEVDRGISPRLRAVVIDALAAIDKVHHLSRPHRLLVSQNRKKGEQGSYDPAFMRVTVSTHAYDPTWTFLHEYGHFLDNRVLHPLSNEYASRYDEELVPFLEACMSSHAVQGLIKVQRGGRRFLTPRDRMFIDEALEDHELFARAYAQWISTTSGGSILRERLQRRIETVHHFGGKACIFQWDHSEFADIMLELEKLFQRKGMR